MLLRFSPNNTLMKCRFVLLILLVLVGQVSAAVLGDVWPASRQLGRYDAIGLKYTLGPRLTLLPGSAWILIDGKLQQLKDPIQAAADDLFVPDELIAILKKKNIISEEVESKKEYPVVVLDPGHGGRDPGAIGLAGLYEKDVALDLTRRVRNYLDKQPLIVKMTRTEDRYLALSERVDLANRWQASAFISIHCNTFPLRSKTGFQVYRYNNSLTPSQRENAPDIGRQFPLEKYMPRDVHGEFLQIKNYTRILEIKDRESLNLSRFLKQSLAHRSESRKTEFEANFHVLRRTLAPAVLLEAEFLSNPRMEVMMQVEVWRDRLAKEIAAGILHYFGLTPLG